MRKAPLLLLILAWMIQATAQEKTVAQLKKELEEHPQQDARRVDKLIAVVFNVFTSIGERNKLSEEALSISQKINYKAGEAYALAQLGGLRVYEGSPAEGDCLVLK